ncbi:hypothetical protein BDV93DRAFT_13651 [Ceratobasidium sp. AG-I]|nr:hypothetical protein BDV93DRAFT_13651 [Ceratobasidium sp. AG-I]
MMATGGVTPTAGAVATQVNKANPDLAITHNLEMTASFSSGLASFVSEAVGQPAGTAVITATATATNVVASTTAAAVTATASSYPFSWISETTKLNGTCHFIASTRGNGRNRNGNNQNNGGNNRNNANGNGRNAANNKRSMRPRVRSRIMRDIVLEELA